MHELSLSLNMDNSNPGVNQNLQSLEELRIVFMGTPEFAVASLDALVKAQCNIVGVITAPDKPGGRGMQLQQSDVKKYAAENNLNVFQPEKLKDPQFLEQMKSLKADLQVVVAFRMLPEILWNMPPMGTINLHGSLLPQYRGAAPINWAVINGEKETGVTTFKLQHQIDTGDILLQDRFAIMENDTAGDVHDRMKEIGATLLVKTVRQIAAGNLQEIPQSLIVNNESVIRHAPKIFTETCQVNFAKSTVEVFNFLRGLSPYPAAFTFLQGKKLKIYAADKINKVPTILPGEYETDGKTFLSFACADGYINIVDLQLEGKKRMNIKDFLRGYRFEK